MSSLSANDGNTIKLAMAGIRTHPLRLSIGGRAGTFVSELDTAGLGLLRTEVRASEAMVAVVGLNPGIGHRSGVEPEGQ